MSEIIFPSVTIENFLSILEGGLNLKDRGLLLIEGENEEDPSADSNGAGKSSVADAVCWVLYGVTARGVSGDEVINNRVNRGCRVILKAQTDGDEYLIARHRKHKTHKNRLRISKNGKDITLGTDKLTQVLLEQIIGCTLDVFQAAIYAGQEQMPDLPGMTDKHLKLIVEESSGITILEKAYSLARKQANELGNIVDCAHTATERNKEALNELNDQMRELEACRDDWLESQAKKQAVLRAEMTAHISTAKDLKGKVSKLTVEALIAKREAVCKRIDEIDSIKPDDSDLRAAQIAVNMQEGEIQSINRLIDGNRETVKDSQNLVGRPCENCRKPYTKADISGVVKVAKDKIKNQERLQHKHLTLLNQLVSERDVARKGFEKAQEGASTTALCSQVGKINQGLHLLETEQSNIRAHVDSAQALRSRLRESESESNPFIAAVQSLKDRQKKSKAEIKKDSAKLKANRVLWEDHKGAALLFSPAGMRGEILDSVTPFLNEQTGHYLGVLSDGNITAEWKTIGEIASGEAREKFHIAVENSKGAKSFGGLSGGERRKVRIATAMALQDLVASRAHKPIKLFIADEVDDALDAAGLERLMTILEDKAAAVGSTLIISHNDLGSWVTNTVTVRKTAAGSTIREAS